MWFIAVEVEQETSAPPPKKNLRSAPATQGGNCKFWLGGALEIPQFVPKKVEVPFIIPP